MEFNFFKDYFGTKAYFVHKPNLVLEYEEKNETTYTLDSDLIFWNGKKQIIIKRLDEDGGSFKTNLVTLPTIFRKIVKFFERFEWFEKIIYSLREKMKFGAVLHDGMYDRPSFFERVYADWMLLLAYKVDGVNFFIRWLAFLLVRIFGSSYRNK